MPAVRSASAIADAIRPPKTPAAVEKPIPPLQSGDRLNRREFERRYAAMPNVKKAELVEGVVFMSSALHVETHAEPHYRIIGWLAAYQAATPGVRGADNASLRLDVTNEYQPDVILRLEERLGGRSRIAADQYLEGAPELVVEIAASSASNDLTDKYGVYRRAGVQEYMVWQVYEHRIDWWELVDDDYALLEADDRGVARSRVFPSLWLDVPAMLRGDLTAVFATVQAGLATPEHTGYVEHMAQKG
jgi:Uma2 family endonuclease